MPGTCGVFGRSRELGAVTAFLAAVPSGPSGLVLEGEAGIGKTTVWTAGVADAAARSYQVLSSRPAESEAMLSFAGLGDLLDGVLDPVLAGLPPPQQHALQVASHQPAGRPGPVPQPPNGGGQSRTGLPQAGDILAGRTRRGHGPPRTQPTPAL